MTELLVGPYGVCLAVFIAICLPWIQFTIKRFIKNDKEINDSLHICVLTAPKLPSELVYKSFHSSVLATEHAPDKCKMILTDFEKLLIIV